MRSPLRRRQAALVAIVFAAVFPVLFAPGTARSGTGTLRIDPEALSGRIAQYLLGESELASGAPGSALFGTNVRLSDEHFANRLISQTEPAIAAAPNGRDVVA